jgi:hypothetical protein
MSLGDPLEAQGDFLDYTNWSLTKVLRWDEGETTCVAFSPDGRLVAAGGGDQAFRTGDARSSESIEPGAVQLWDVETGERTLAIRDSGNRTTAASASPVARVGVGPKRATRLAVRRPGRKPQKRRHSVLQFRSAVSAADDVRVRTSSMTRLGLGTIRICRDAGSRSDRGHVVTSHRSPWPAMRRQGPVQTRSTPWLPTASSRQSSRRGSHCKDMHCAGTCRGAAALLLLGLGGLLRFADSSSISARMGRKGRPCRARSSRLRGE